MQAGFSYTDITPPLGTEKMGWGVKVFGRRVVDPICARAAVFGQKGVWAGVLQLDVLSVTRGLVRAIRNAATALCGIPMEHLLVCATHNHAGPAVSRFWDAEPDSGYMATWAVRCAQAVAQAHREAVEAELSFGRSFEWRVAANRRVVMRDGTVRTHGDFSDPQCLALEGPIDPEVGVLAARTPEGRLLGMIVNYACHPTHHMDDDAFSAGFPGVLANHLAGAGCPNMVFLNGAFGNMHTINPIGGTCSMERAGTCLAEAALAAAGQTAPLSNPEIRVCREEVRLPLRPMPEQRQRLGTLSPAKQPALRRFMEKLALEGDPIAEVQTIHLGDAAITGIPAEYFVEHGLSIKSRGFPANVLLAGAANGMLGYVANAEAFDRGGYEVTFGEGCFLDRNAGALLEDAAVRTIRG